MKYFSLILLALISTCLQVKAQKLPNKQEMSAWAPSSIKIDGKTSEWDGKFQAYNNATGLFYTISNDSKNLYLTAKVTDPDIIKYKIIAGGLTLVIQNTDNKNEKETVSISYPIFEGAIRPNFNLKGQGNIPPITDPEKFNDSIMVVNNSKFTAIAKTIKVIGIDGIDSLASIYNDYQIKTVGLFDSKKEFIYELSIPLDRLKLTSTTFFYHVLLNGGPSHYIGQVPAISNARAPNGAAMPQEKIDEINTRLASSFLTRYATTDFWGQYTLAKHP
ncbi:hypothetical protein ACFGVR_14870 [Mucilaginibacter sp. AW1-3]